MARAACQQLVERIDARGTVAGAFETTLAGAQRLMPERHPPLRPDIGRDQTAYICYLDLAIAKAPPLGGRSFDRAIYLIVGNQAEMLSAGYGESLPVRAP